MAAGPPAVSQRTSPSELTGSPGSMTPDKHELYLSTATTLKWLLGAAWLLPLCGFVIEIFGGYWSGRKSKTAAWLAVACIATSFLLSFSALMTWRGATTEHRTQQYEALHAEHAGMAMPIIQTLLTLTPPKIMHMPTRHKRMHR